MSEIVHPPIDLSLESANSVEQNFAQAAALLLIDSCKERDEIISNNMVCTQLTERVDMESSTEGLTVAMRLRSVPAFTSETFDLDDCRPNPDLLVIALEHATFNEYVQEADEDDELPWQPYVLAVLDAFHPEKAQVLDAKTGRNLRPIDLEMARILINKLAEELGDVRCTETDLVSFLSVTYRPLASGGADYSEFDSAEFIDTEPCNQPCANDHLSCSHLPYSLN
jgi:hypothetical protein